MRRARITNPEAATRQAVLDLRNKFDYPVDPAPASNPFIGGGGGAPTVVVAASDASDFSKAKADFVCTGLDDEDPINIAAASLNGVYGRILLTEGTFNLSNTISLTSGISLIGMGRSATTLDYASTTGPIISPGAGAEIANMTILGTATDFGIQGGTHDYVVIRQCFFSWVTTAIDLTGDYWQILNNGEVTPFSTTFVRDNSLFRFTRIIGNTTEGVYDMGDGTDWLIANNSGESAIYADGSLRAAIVGNSWSVNPNAPDDSVIDLANCQYITIADNSMAEASYTALKLDTCDFITVTGNVFASSEHGVWLTNSSDCAITGNLIHWSGFHGIYVAGNHNTVVGNRIIDPATGSGGSYDGIYVAGNRNLIEANQINPESANTRNGVNVASGECNMVVGNDLGDCDLYTSDCLTDTGANTQLFYPNDATYGDNFTDCGTGS